jgi:hypothetical protein
MDQQECWTAVLVTMTSRKGAESEPCTEGRPSCIKLVPKATKGGHLARFLADCLTSNVLTLRAILNSVVTKLLNGRPNLINVPDPSSGNTSLHYAGLSALSDFISCIILARALLTRA